MKRLGVLNTSAQTVDVRIPLPKVTGSVMLKLMILIIKFYYILVASLLLSENVYILAKVSFCIHSAQYSFIKPTSELL